MHPQDDDPQAKAEAGVDLAADRRRAGRRELVSARLVPLLRGQLDPEAPADPQLGKPGRFSVSRKWELVSGAAIALTLLLVGAALRFAV